MQTSLLLCDDMPEIREFIRSEVDRHPDLKVVGEASNGLEAVEMAKMLRPDLVVMDLSMPRMDGAAALAKILEHDAAIAIVILTGMEDSALETKLITSGASAFIRKGASLTEIITTIREVIGSNQEDLGSEVVRVETLNEQLEERVRRRTAELESKTRELEAKTLELQASVAEMESFAYSVSHDLRAPLRAMDGFSRILLDELGDSIPQDKRRYLENIRKNAQGMQELVDGLLAFSRLGRAALAPRLLDPSILVRQAISDIGSVLERTDVEIVIEDLPSCYADPVLLKQVFVNLLSNAVKFSNRVPGATVVVGAEKSGSEVAYFVKDNGVGFDQRFVEQIFGVFQRLHRAEDYEGTGIGLALVNRIVTRHGGRVWAESAVGEGATFRFVIPAVQAGTE